MFRNINFKFYRVKSDGDVVCSATLPRNVEVPTVCPVCKAVGVPVLLPSQAVERDEGGVDFVASLFCTSCRMPFMATYTTAAQPVAVQPTSLPSRVFDKLLVDLSPRFVRAYNQALAAEAMELDELSGMAFRKALELLIKDFLIYRSPDASDAIQSEALGSCIHNRIDNSRLKSVARGATWLGNDFTHYQRKYEEYDLNLLKVFIDWVVHWILMELTADLAATLGRR